MRRLVTLLALAGFALCAQTRRETALDRYVARPDASFTWQLEKTLPGAGIRASVLSMTSQNWRQPHEVNRTEWKHWVTVYQPEQVEGDTGLLFITGGDNDGKLPEKLDPFLEQLAAKTHTVAVELRMVPNQPLSFFGESRPRTEDAIVAFTWKKFLETGDESWPLRLPMTKAAVRAMDAAEAFLAGADGRRVQVRRWVVAGASKRGQTTWTTAAVDRRVVAIMPIVIDLLNMQASFNHHWRVYGTWAPAVGDYVDHGIMEWQGTEQYQRLMEIEEPFEYRDRYTMPKFIVNATGDQFFVPDSSQFYFDALPGEKYLRYVPNTDHGVTRRSDAADSLLAYYESIVKGWPRPQFSWSISPQGRISVETKDRPVAVKLWQATNPAARDFRLDQIGPAYQATPLSASADGRYEVELKAPPRGYMASFVELTFRTPGGGEWKFTTGVKVMPDVYPFPPHEPHPPAGARRSAAR